MLLLAFSAEVAPCVSKAEESSVCDLCDWDASLDFDFLPTSYLLAQDLLFGVPYCTRARSVTGVGEVPICHCN